MQGKGTAMNKIKCMLLDEVLGHPRGKPVSLQELPLL